MLPVVALVGRPNVGKSTLFNVLTRSRDALVADFPGLTRDRQYGLGKLGERPYLVVDTGGLDGGDKAIDQMVTEQALLAATEADLIALLVDGRDGLSHADKDVAERLRRLGKPLFLVVNKTESMDPMDACSDFFELGFARPPLAISASHRRGVHALVEQLLAELQESTDADDADDDAADDDGRVRLAVVGRPNVGKSTLVNRLLGEQRVLAFDQPGTTRDSVAIAFEKDSRRYTLIDTAGVRRRSRVNDTVEKFSVIKTLQAIEKAHVTLMMLDARQQIADQDATLLGYVLERGRALVIAVNKWDRLPAERRAEVRTELDRKLSFLDFAETHFISALHGSGVIDLLDSVDRAYSSATRNLATSELTQILQQALEQHPPPRVGGHPIRLRYAHQGGQNPPIIVIHGNRTTKVPDAYRRYLVNVFRRRLKLRGTPVEVAFRSGDNPFQPSGRKAHHRNRPEPRTQKRKKARS